MSNPQANRITGLAQREVSDRRQLPRAVYRGQADDLCEVRVCPMIFSAPEGASLADALRSEGESSSS